MLVLCLLCSKLKPEFFLEISQNFNIINAMNKITIEMLLHVTALLEYLVGTLVTNKTEAVE